MEFEMSAIANKMDVLLADTYAVYLKTQNYHWHVRGPLFKSLHTLFEGQYVELADAVDEIAERILTLGRRAPATFKEFERLKTITDGDSSLTANEMLLELAKDHDVLIRDINEAIFMAQDNNDEGTVSLLSDRVVAHEKARWMLRSSCESD